VTRNQHKKLSSSTSPVIQTQNYPTRYNRMQFI